MSMSGEKHLLRGVVAGVMGGLVASWVMNEFMAGPGKTLSNAVETDEDKAKQAEAQQNPEAQVDATMKTADAIATFARGGAHLTYEGEKKGGPMVHYAFGALMGGLYGGLAEYAPAVRAGFGTTFGSALFTGADLVAVPALHLSGSPMESSTASLAAHLVYGATTEFVRRVMRSML